MVPDCTCDACVAMGTCMECHAAIEGTRFYLPTTEDERFWLGMPSTIGPLCEACRRRREEGTDGGTERDPQARSWEQAAWPFDRMN